jgi:hypothetical protein
VFLLPTEGMVRGRPYRVVASAAATATLLAAAWTAVASGPSAHAASRSTAPATTAAACPSGHRSHRDPANPLDLPHAPGSDPLTGAHFFVDGPRHGEAAGAIARLLRADPHRYPDSYSWARFKASLRHGVFARRLAASGVLRYKVHQLEKIAAQPEVQRFSVYSMGGGPGKLYAFAKKIFCYNHRADPGSIPIVNTYFLHPVVHSCPSAGELSAAGPDFRRRINEVIAATGNRPVVWLLELDAYGSSSCMARRGTLGRYEALIRYEVDRFASLPHGVVYIEGGYSDSNSAAYTARALNHSDIRRIRGFYTNDTHLNWTISEVRWANKIARWTHGAHYIVNTAQNGNGPQWNRDRVHNGNENLCNPPGRALGIRDTTHTGFRYADAFMWTHVPGNSSGCGGGPPASVFWVARAIGLASRANNRLGPGYASDRY